MNLLNFLHSVDSLSQAMDKEQLIALIHDIARILPENERTNFLDRMMKSQSDITTDSSKKQKGYEKPDKTKYKELKERLLKIESREICLTGDLNEEYDDWYNSEAEEFIYEDPEGVGKILEEACGLVHECVEQEQYKEGYELSKLLIGLEVMVDGEYLNYTDAPIGIEEFRAHGLAELDYKTLVMDALYLTYCGTSLEERADALYCTMQNAGQGDISMEMIMQRGEELPEFDEFLPMWISYLGNECSKMAQRLLNEAVELSDSSECMLSSARAYCEYHPGLYETYIKNNIGKVDSKELLLVGKEALEKIDKKYLVRSQIALVMAEIMLKENSNKVTGDVEQCWLEAFRSDTRAVHFLRLMMECRDFSVWKTEADNINHNMQKTMRRTVFGYERSGSPQENGADVNQIYLVALLSGEYEFVKNNAMDHKGAVGWSGSYMKEGLAAFMLILLNTDPEEHFTGIKSMISKLVSSVGFKVTEYQQGVPALIKDRDSEWFWKCFSHSKQLFPMAESQQEPFLHWVEQLVKERVEGIMEGNHRNYYYECAEYVAALGEVWESRGVANGKQKIMLSYKQMYSRRSAFHRELRACGMRDK